MRHHQPARTLVAVLATVLATGAVLAVPARAGAPTVELQPQKLVRGADIAVPHIDDGDFVDGARRVELPGTVVRIIGPSLGGWMVGTQRADAAGGTSGGRVVHVSASGSVRTVVRDLDPWDVVVSEDGSALLAVGGLRNRSAKVTVWSPVDGHESSSRRFSGYPEILAGHGGKVLLRSTRGTFWWNYAKDNVRSVTKRLTGPASITHDLLTTYARDPYLGGCTRLARLRHPRIVIWESCRDRVTAFSPDGTQMLTFPILTDGVGPGELRLRKLDGTRLASWSTNWFSGWAWESPGTVLLDVNGRRKFATVRCTAAACENATDPVKAPAPRSPGP